MTGYGVAIGGPHWNLQCPPAELMPESVLPALREYQDLKARVDGAYAALSRLESEPERERRQRLDLEGLTAAAHRGETPTGTPNEDALPAEIRAAQAAFRGLDRALIDAHEAVLTAIRQAATEAHADALEASQRHAEAVEATLAATQAEYGRWVLAARAVQYWQAVNEGRPAAFGADPSMGSFVLNGVYVDRADAGAAGSSIMREVSTVQQLLTGPTKRIPLTFTEPKRRPGTMPKAKPKAAAASEPNASG